MYERSQDRIFTPEEDNLRLFAVDEEEIRQEINNVHHITFYSENLSMPGFTSRQLSASLPTFWYIEISFKPLGNSFEEGSELLKQTKELHAYIGPASESADKAREPADFAFAGLESRQLNGDPVKLTVRRFTAREA
jgi:hypothetical protein